MDALVSPYFTVGQFLRIRIPASLDCAWDTSVTNPTFTVNGSGSVNPAATYPDSRTMRIQVTGTFTPVSVGITPSKLTIGSITRLAFVNLNSASAGHLELSWDDGATYQAVDDRTYTILDANPFITGVETCDLNSDGSLDALHVIFNKNIKDSSIAAAATGFAIAGASGLAFSSTTNGDTANDNDVYITFTDGVLKSGQTVQFSYDTDVVGANITDNDGTPHALPDQGPLTAADRAGPAILSARTRTVNTVELTLSEPVDDTTMNGGDFTFSGFATGEPMRREPGSTREARRTTISWLSRLPRRSASPKQALRSSPRPELSEIRRAIRARRPGPWPFQRESAPRPCS